MDEIEQDGGFALEVNEQDEPKSEDELTLDRHKDLLDKIREKHDEIAIYLAPKGFESVGIVVIAAPLNPKIAQGFVNQISKDGVDKAVAAENFAINCVVYPDRATVKNIFIKKPFSLPKSSAGPRNWPGATLKSWEKTKTSARRSLTEVSRAFGFSVP